MENTARNKIGSKMRSRKNAGLHILLVVLLAFGLLLTGCSTSTQHSNEPASTSTTGDESKTTESQATAPTVTQKPKKVILQYVKPEQVRAELESEIDIFLIDIQLEEDYRKHHIKGSIATYAFPVKTNEDKQKLVPVLDDILTSEAPVYILCPRGKSGAENTFNFLAEQGVDNDRLFIIEGGQAGWPYDELVEKQS